MGLIRITYEIVTPESAENGDAEERGWIDEEGTEHSVKSAIAFLSAKCLEASGSEFHPGIWYMEADGRTDYRTGANTRESYHLKGFTWGQERKIHDAVTKSSR